MSMVTAMDGIGNVNHVDTVHDDVSKEYKQAMEKAMENKEEKEVLETTNAKIIETVDEAVTQIPQAPQGPLDIWLQFDTISVGSGEKTATFDLAKLLAGIEKLADLTMVRQEVQPAEENTTDDIEEVKKEAKWQHNGQPDNPTTNE